MRNGDRRSLFIEDLYRGELTQSGLEIGQDAREAGAGSFSLESRGLQMQRGTAIDNSSLKV